MWAQLVSRESRNSQHLGRAEEKESPKFERAAMKWLRRYLDENELTFKEFAKLVRSLEQRH